MAVHRRSTGAGPVLTNAVHDIDDLRFICGDIVSVQAMTSNAVRHYPVEDTAAILLRFASGALGTLTVSDTAVAPWSCGTDLGRESLLSPQRRELLPSSPVRPGAFDRTETRTVAGTVKNRGGAFRYPRERVEVSLADPTGAANPPFLLRRARRGRAEDYWARCRTHAASRTSRLRVGANGPDGRARKYLKPQRFDLRPAWLRRPPNRHGRNRCPENRAGNPSRQASMCGARRSSSCSSTRSSSVLAANVDEDFVAVPDQSERTAFVGFRRDVADEEAAVRSGEPPVGDQGAGVGLAHAFQDLHRAEHLGHAGAALGAFVAQGRAPCRI